MLKINVTSGFVILYIYYIKVRYDIWNIDAQVEF